MSYQEKIAARWLNSILQISEKESHEDLVKNLLMIYMHRNQVSGHDLRLMKGTFHLYTYATGSPAIWCDWFPGMSNMKQKGNWSWQKAVLAWIHSRGRFHLQVCRARWSRSNLLNNFLWILVPNVYEKRLYLPALSSEEQLLDFFCITSDTGWVWYIG